MNYLGQFNWQGEVFELNTTAVSTYQAWRSFCYGLSKKLGVNIVVLFNYFNGKHDNYTIRQQVRRA